MRRRTLTWTHVGQVERSGMASSAQIGWGVSHIVLHATIKYHPVLRIQIDRIEHKSWESADPQ